MQSPLETIGQILSLSGALVEVKGEQALEVVAPPELAAALEIPEHTTLYANPLDTPRGARVLSYTPELFEQLSSVLSERGRLVEGIIEGLYLKRTGVAAAAGEAFAVLNGVGVVVDYHEEMISYVVCNFHYAALSDERTEGIVAAAVNEFSGVPATELSLILLSQLAASRRGRHSVNRKSSAQIYGVAGLSARERIAQELAPFRKSLIRRLQRDVSRVQYYYRSLIAEINRKIDRKQLTGQEKETEKERILATQGELRRKVLDLRERYAMEVKVRFINAARLYVPVLIVRYNVQRRQSVREVSLIWNPLRKDFDDLGCEGCGGQIRNFYLCDERLHMVCSGCFRCPHCGKNSCRACHAAACAKCGNARDLPGKDENA